MQDGQLATAGAAATAEAVASTAEVLAGTVFMVVGSTVEASAVALSTAVVVSVGDVSPVAVSMAVAFVVAVLVGATGVTTGAITDSLMMSSSATSAFRGGGAGAIRMNITVTTITRTITMAMDTAGTRTITMDTAGTATTMAAVMDTAMAADRGIPGISEGGDKLGCGSSGLNILMTSFEIRPATHGGDSQHSSARQAQDTRRDSKAVVFLASDDNSYITGTELFVDGGFAQV
jgi:hypothetical protein